MQFQVPQFIETEAKIVGPLTLKQFGYLGAAGILSFLLFFVLQTWLWFIATAFLGISAAAFAFIKYHGRPLIIILKSALVYAWKPKLYLWQRQEEVFQLPKMPEMATKPTSRIKSLWLNLITKKPPINKTGL